MKEQGRLIFGWLNLFVYIFGIISFCFVNLNTYLISISTAIVSELITKNQDKLPDFFHREEIL